MKYGKDFWCLDDRRRRLPAPVWPQLEPFKYPDGTRGFWLREHYQVEFIFRGQHWRLLVRYGFDFDGASIKRLVWSLIGDPLALNILIAALIHDIMFCVNHKNWPLEAANSLFYEIQQATGSPWVKRRMTTAFVRCLGWITWKKSDDYMEKYSYYFEAEMINGD